MEIIETSFGKTVKWGYNCIDNLRDLRKLNDKFSNHHPNYEEFCKKSDELNARIVDILKRLDEICEENKGSVWSVFAAKEYEILEGECSRRFEELENLCIFDYPRDARKYGYSYCI